MTGLFILTPAQCRLISVAQTISRSISRLVKGSLCFLSFDTVLIIPLDFMQMVDLRHILLPDILLFFIVILSMAGITCNLIPKGGQQQDTSQWWRVSLWQRGRGIVVRIGVVILTVYRNGQGREMRYSTLRRGYMARQLKAIMVTRETRQFTWI